MTAELMLSRKWTFKAHGQRVVFIKKRNERTVHVLMKAFIWALYLPEYPDLSVEIKVGDRFKPDVVSLNMEGHPLFWGEAGQVGERKLRSLLRRYPHTHFAIGKWDQRLDPHVEIVRKALKGLKRSAPCDLITFDAGSDEQFIDDFGQISITLDDLEWIRLEK